MSELQTALIVIGAVIIISVLAYNKWQEKKYRQLAERSFAAKPEDTLVGYVSQAVDPNAAASPAAAQPSDVDRLEPRFSQADPLAPTSRPDSSSDEKESTEFSSERCSPIDYCHDLPMKTALPGSRILEAAERLFPDFGKTVRLDGYDAASDRWRRIDRSGGFSALRLSLQLVDRRGMVEKAELERFDSAVRKLAGAIGLNSGPSGVEEAMVRAASLNQYCEKVDIQIGLNVMAIGEPFSGKKILEAAEAMKLPLRGDGSFHRLDAEGRTLFRLSNLDNAPFSSESLPRLTSAGLTLELDVPRTNSGQDVVDELYNSAVSLATRLGGKVVDDNRQSVGEDALTGIRSQLNIIHADMRNRGMPAGEGLALRLFS